MNFNALIQSISKKQKGSWFKVQYTSDVPLTAKAKKDGLVVYKQTTSTVRWGIAYKNIASVKERDAKVEGPVRHELKWGAWSEQHPELIINHTNKAGEFKQYVRLYASPNHSQSTYFINGQEITKEGLKALGIVLPSYFNKKDERPEALTINVANIEKIW